MYHFKQKNSKIFSAEGPSENVWGPTKMFPRAPLWLSTATGLDSLQEVVSALSGCTIANPCLATILHDWHTIVL